MRSNYGSHQISKDVHELRDFFNMDKVRVEMVPCKRCKEKFHTHFKGSAKQIHYCPKCHSAFQAIMESDATL